MLVLLTRGERAMSASLPNRRFCQPLVWETKPPGAETNGEVGRHCGEVVPGWLRKADPPGSAFGSRPCAAPSDIR